MFHFVADATTKNRGAGYECAGKAWNCRAGALRAPAGTNVRKRTHVPPLGSIAAVCSRSVAQRLRLSGLSARLSSLG